MNGEALVRSTSLFYVPKRKKKTISIHVVSHLAFWIPPNPPKNCPKRSKQNSDFFLPHFLFWFCSVFSKKEKRQGKGTKKSAPTHTPFVSTACVFLNHHTEDLLLSLILRSMAGRTMVKRLCISLAVAVLTYVSHVDAALCQGYTGTVLGGDCKEQWCPHPLNNVEYPKWPYCGRKPNDPDTKYAWMAEVIPPQDRPYHTCGAGRVLRHDAAGLVCRIYNDDWSAGECFDGECCTGGVCTDMTCGDGWTLRSDAAEVSCYFGCDQQTCCDEPTVKKVPGQNPVGMLFVDKDPERFEFGGTATILRAIDESDITHYRVYWGFAMVTRKAPSCILRQPVGWETWKWMDSTKLYKEFAVSGCDIQFEIPMNTKAQDWALCDISYDRKDIFTGATDKCNPHYLMVVSVNENGEKPVTRHQTDNIGPVLAISDYEADLNYACAESGLVGGQDLVNIDDVPLGVQGDCPSAAECAKRCREYSGEKGPCRIFTWAYPTGGPNSNTCWMESQAVSKVHYTVRVSGPAVCPSADEATAPPTGLERPKCTRWRRYQNKVTFTPGQQWATNVGGINYVERPLGQFQNFETCKSICDMDVLCIGFYWQKSLLWNAGDLRLLKMCRMMRIDSGERNELLEVGTMSVRNMDNLFDTWLCTRATMAPMVIGYVFKANPFGYHTCGAQTATSQKVVASVDCCATACDEDANCKAFTFWNVDKRCDLFAACSIAKVDKVAGCAYESCFDGYGASTYMKETTRTIEIVDRFPRQGTKDGIPINVQTNGMMEGAEVVCGVRYLDDTRDELPESAEQMKADASLKDVVKSAFVVNDVASMVLTQEKAGALKDGLNYKVRCAVVDRAKYAGLPAYIDTPQSFQLQEPKGYQFVRHGRCIGYKECALIEDKGKDVTYEACLAFSDSSAIYTGFSWGFSDGWCRLYTDCPPNGVAKNDMNYYCWKKTDEWETLNNPGNGVCDQVCPVGDTCQMSRTMGVCDRNIYIPRRQSCTDVANECASNPCGSGQTCYDPNTESGRSRDFVCWVTDDPASRAIGQPAEMNTLNECDASPCGSRQTCTDNDISKASRSDYLCVCTEDTTKNATGKPADDCPDGEAAAQHYVSWMLLTLTTATLLMM